MNILTIINEIAKEFIDEEIKSIYLWNDEEDPLYEKILNRLVEENSEEINLWIEKHLFFDSSYDIENDRLSIEAKKIARLVYERLIKWEDSVLLKHRNEDRYVFENINDRIIGDNIVLINTSEYRNLVEYDIVDEYIDEIKKAKDFETYASLEEPEDIKSGLMLNLYVPFSFMIVNKISNEVMGTISLRQIDEDTSKVLDLSEISYYVYKDYRGKGYAVEAAKLLIQKYFERGLKGYYRTDKPYELIVKPNNISCIKLKCNSKNIASKRVAEKSGFVYEGTNHYYRYMYGIPQHELSFYIDGEIYSKINNEKEN